MKTTTIRLQKENMKFSVGHFTIFSATKRERLHGHNFNVALEFDAPVGLNGICFDYSIYKKKIEAMCREWNEYFVIPKLSPHLCINEVSDPLFGDMLLVTFNGAPIPFLKSDVLELPIANATVEEFARLMLENLIAEGDFSRYGITRMEVSVFTGPGQCATARYSQRTE